jgi:hypothetical protein
MRGRACVELGRATLGARPEEVAGSRDRDRFTDAGLYPITIAPDGSEVVPATKPQPDGALLKALARAWRWQRMLDDGVYASVSEIGDAENISKSYVSRILRLALLAPDIVDGILASRTDQGMVLESLERPLPGSWEEQRVASSSQDIVSCVARWRRSSRSNHCCFIRNVVLPARWSFSNRRLLCFSET